MRASVSLILQNAPKEVIHWVQIRATGRPFVLGYEVVAVLLLPGKAAFGDTTRHTVLLPYSGPVPGHLLDPGLHHSLHDLQIDLSIDPKTCLKDVRRHHVPVGADHTKDHDRVWELGLYHSGHIVGAHSNPSMVLPVVGLVLTEILLIREEPQHVGLLRTLQLVEELGGVKQPSVLGGLGQKLASLHFIAFAVQTLVYTSLNCPFINPQFSSHGSYGLGGVNVDHGLNPFDKICIFRLPAVVLILWSS